MSERCRCVCVCMYVYDVEEERRSYEQCVDCRHPEEQKESSDGCLRYIVRWL
jgi:hypothetical protein